MTTTSTAPRQTVKPPAARGSFVERWLAMIFLAPTLLGMALFTFLPIIGSLVLAFFRWDIISAPQFVGLANFASLAQDPTVRVSFLNTIVFVAVAVILQLGIALSLASMLQARMPSWLRVFLRSTFFFPPGAVGRVGVHLHAVHVQRTVRRGELAPVAHRHSRSTLADQSGGLRRRRRPGLRLAKLRVLLPPLPWRPEQYSERTARGSKPGRRHGLGKQFSYVTLPLISPTVLVASVMAIISALQVFDQPYVLTNGGPGDSTRTAVMVIFESAFQQLEFGEASAIGLVLTVLILAVTALQFRLSRRFVFYQ